MSYSVDLWSSYNNVRKRIESNFLGLKQFIKMLCEYHSALLSYSTNLRKIYDIECKSQNESLQIGIKCFKSDILNQFRSLNEFISSIKDDIINPLIEFREIILSKIRKNVEETIKTEKSYHNCVIGLESVKKNFYSSIKEIENYKTKYEITKRQNMEENNFQDYNVIESNEIKITTAVKSAKEKEKKYIKYIKDTNIMQEEYIEIKKRNLDQIQSLDEEMGINLKDSLRKFVIFKISYLRNLQYDLDQKTKLIENINIRKDIFDYIIKNSTTALPPEKYKYSPYIFDEEKKYINYTMNNNKDIYNEVKAYILNSFNLKNGKEIMEIKSENLINIENLVNKAFSETNFNTEDKKRIMNYSELKRSRRYLLDNINKIRTKNKLNLGENAFNNIGEILKENIIGLNKENEPDFESYKLIIIISTSLYKINFSENKKENTRIFLLNYIINYPVWKNNKFWEKMIQYEIIEEMIKQKKYNILIISKEKHDNKLTRIQSISKSYLKTYLYHMISFNVDINIINDIITLFSDYYFFDKTTKDSLINILRHYKREEIIKDELISNGETEETNEIKNTWKKQPLDNIIKAKQRQKQEKEDNNIINSIENDNLENLNINLINKDNNNIENDNNEDEENKIKKINNDEYKEEDIKSQIALTENSYEKESLDLSIREKSKLKIVNED